MTKIIPRFPIRSYFIYSIVAKFVARATESPRNPVNKGLFAPKLFASKTACRATPASAAGGGSSEQGLAPRSKFAERERDERISGTARGVAKQLQVLLPLPKKGPNRDTIRTLFN